MLRAIDMLRDMWKKEEDKLFQKKRRAIHDH
jgi:hypothetical protein